MDREPSEKTKPFSERAKSGLFWITSSVLFLLSLLFMLGAVFLHPAYPQADGASSDNPALQQPLKRFNHDLTSFPLLGAHRRLECSQCHLGGKFKGLPTSCENCHNGQRTYGKPANHIVTQESCGTCHNNTQWFPATFRHNLARATGQCATCHNGQKALGKPPNHIQTTQQCDRCHGLTAWFPAGFKHDLAQVTGQCATCHNGQRATGKPPNHIQTTQQCDACHKTTAWIPSSFANHDNPRLIGAHARLDCKTCHTQSFSSVYYRDGTQYGSCANCHTRDYKYPGPREHRDAGPTLAESLRVNAFCAQCHEHASYREF